MLNLYSAFQIQRRPEATFLTCGERVVTYRELDEKSAQFANALLAGGLRAGDRVAVQAEKSPEAIFLYLACLRAGLVYVPLNPAYTPAEISYFLDDADPALFVCSPGNEITVPGSSAKLSLGAAGDGSLPELAARQSPIHSVPELPPHALAALVYTSGTTGRSKGAMLSHANLLTNAEALVGAWEITNHDILLHALPLFHVHGLFVGLHTILLTGGRLILHPKFELEAVLTALPQVTLLMGVPTFYTRLLTSPRLNRELVKNMRLFISGSAPLLAETHGEFEARTGHSILERYGMTETGMLCSNPLHGKRQPGSVGFPLPGVELRIRNDRGEPCAPGGIGGLEVRGPNVFSGYWRRAPGIDFSSDGFFQTGDIGLRDEDGYVHILGRSKDLIISGGYNVYPSEVETVLDEIPGVVESAVVGVPHPDFGEGVVAVVKLLPGANLTEQEILDFTRTRLAPYKAPKRVIFGELPRNSMGKVQKRKLRDELSGLFSA